MAEEVSVVWWTADASLFQSIVHPGVDEGFVAIYSKQPDRDERARRVAVVDRAVLPRRRGMARGTIDGDLVTMAAGERTVTLDVSKPAPLATRTPPWEFVPAHQTKAPSDQPGRRWTSLSRRERLTVVLLCPTLWFAAMYIKALSVTDGDQRESVQIVVVGTALYAALVAFLFVLERFWPDEDDEDED